MRELPILFSAAMVRAILDGRKTVTRRVVKPQPPARNGIVNAAYCGHPDVWLPTGNICEDTPKRWTCPYGRPGDRLWVRETWKTHSTFDHLAPRNVPQSNVFYAAGPQAYSPSGSRWRSSIHMPRWASRITLEVTAVRVERLQDISEAQARAEGLGNTVERAHHWFANLWESINGTGSWAANPWVWVVEFRRVEVP